MKTLMLLSVALLMTASVARADHISVYSDATGSSCILTLPGFLTTSTVLHKFTVGSVGSTFSLEFPAGSLFIGFAPAFLQPIPVVGYEGISIGYGQCMQGSFAVGTITAILAPGILWVTPADGFSDVMVADCEFVLNAATCGGAYVGISDPYCPSCQTVATDQKTWGAVKSLYRE